MPGWVAWFLYCILDALCILVAYVPSLILNAKPEEYLNRRGVNCDDINFKYPHIIQTTMNNELWAVINIFPAMLFGVGEVFTNRKNLIQSFYKVATTFLFGAFTSNSLTYLAKFYVGQLRPDFLAVCEVVCTDKAIKNKGWVVDPVCSQPHNNNDARLSFYSLYSSHVMYYMVFTAYYIQARMKGSGWTHLVKPLMQLLLILLAMWVGYTRVNDHKNHLYDVLIGLLQGGFLAFLMVHYLFPEVFKLPEEVEESDEQQVLVGP